MTLSRIFMVIMAMFVALPDAALLPGAFDLPSSASARVPASVNMPGVSLAGMDARRDKPRRDHDTDRHRNKHGRADRTRKSAKQDPKQTKQLAAQCEQVGWTWLQKAEECTHGPDPAPPGVTLAHRSRPITAARARVAAKAMTCDGDGQSGPRVQVLYARSADVPSHFTLYFASFRAWAMDADAIMRQSAAAAGGGRRFRWVTTPDCEIDVQEAVLSPSGDDNFGNTVAQLKARGYNRTDRKYLIFADTNLGEFCGLGTVLPDDRPGPDNRHNSGPGYARVNVACWDDPGIPAHELMHTLGAVQPSAPHYTEIGHCIDEYDVMCYPDFPQFGCPAEALDYRYDCGNDDFFDPTPSGSGYLATHWNTANNLFLVATEPEPLDTTPPSITWVSPVGDDEEFSIAAGSVALQVNASDDRAISRVEFAWYDEVRERVINLGTDSTAPYTASLNVADLWPEYNEVFAVAYDTATNSVEENIWILKEGTENPPDPDPEPIPDFLTVAITAPATGATFMTDTMTPIGVNVTKGSPTTTVEVRFCPGAPCSWPAGTAIGSDAIAPYSVPWTPTNAGQFTLVARANDADQTLSEPVTVTVKKQEPPPLKDKKKKKKKHKKKKH